MGRLVAVILLVAACGGAPLPPDEPRGSGRTTSRAKHKTGSEATREVADAEPVARQGKHWGGWRYAGEREACYYVVGRQCFADKADACKAAGCKRDRCRERGAGPATVTCR